LNASITLSSSFVVGVDNNHNGNNVNESTTSFATSSAVETISTDTHTDCVTASTDNESIKSVHPLNMNDQQFPRYVTPKDFALLKVIGMGSFGKVLQVQKRNNSSNNNNNNTDPTSSTYSTVQKSKLLLD
jgi:hypothetical protein